jgi:hypothetical protein
MPEALTWQGIPCDLAYTRVDLFDISANLAAGVFLAIGKFPRQPHPIPEIENMPILGLNFVTHNQIDALLSGKQGSLTASFRD